jgi:putative tricarboxylic transport membrane protein
MEPLFLPPPACPEFRSRRLGEDVRNRDLVSSVVCIVLGGLFVVGALREGLMRRGVPGPGFLPFFTGLALVFVSLFVFIPALGHRDKAERRDLFPGPNSLRKSLLAVLALVAFGAAIEYAGYLLTTFFFMIFVTRIMEPKRWRTVTVLAFVTAVMSYLLFVILLNVQLPEGLLGF